MMETPRTKEIIEDGQFDKVRVQLKPYNRIDPVKTLASIGKLRRMLERGERLPSVVRAEGSSPEDAIQNILILCRIAEELCREGWFQPDGLGGFFATRLDMVFRFRERKIDHRQFGSIGTYYLDRDEKVKRIVLPECYEGPIEHHGPISERAPGWEVQGGDAEALLAYVRATRGRVAKATE